MLILCANLQNAYERFTPKGMCRHSPARIYENELDIFTFRSKILCVFLIKET
jgi:hypothetical protein